ncbi:Yip1 family protein [Anaerosporobacter sp.]|uniref:Yip1 family protein n=1 Tax=Anaerosporobacter sp. TaxID=1872529 RepID=UPI00286ED23F|nr:Yip1 family protein [Anaerosporobacter sp.]
MANFCGKCGKPLQDGEVCSCSASTVNEQPVNAEQVNAQPVNEQPVQPVQQANVGGQVNMQPVQGQPSQGEANSQPNQFSQQASQAAAVAGKYAKNIWQILLDIWKAPADNLKSFVNESNFVNALIVIGAEALLTMLFSCVLVRQFYKLMMGFIGGLAYFMDDIDVNYFSTCLGALIMTVLSACIFAGVTMLIVKQVGKANKTFKEAICITATKSMALLPFLVVGLVLSIINLPIGLLFVGFGGVLGLLYVHTSLDDGSIENSNKRIYVTFLIIAIHVIALALISYLYMKI